MSTDTPPATIAARVRVTNAAGGHRPTSSVPAGVRVINRGSSEGGTVSEKEGTTETQGAPETTPTTAGDDLQAELRRLKKAAATLQKERDEARAAAAAEAEAKARKDAEARGEYEKILAAAQAKAQAAEAALLAREAEHARTILEKDLAFELRGMSSAIARRGAVVEYLALDEADRPTPAEYAARLAADPQNAALFAGGPKPAASTGAGAPATQAGSLAARLASPDLQVRSAAALEAQQKARLL